jgi:hypothetical protein
MGNEAIKEFDSRIRLLPGAARKLLCVIARQAYHGSLRSKGPGIATMPEVHEACGLDVDGMYSVLQVLRRARLIELEGEYPFEEIRFAGDGIAVEEILQRCDAGKIAIEDVVAELRFDLIEPRA